MSGGTTVTAARELLRDLDEERFGERYGCDRFTATVLGNRFRYIAEHMCSQLLTTAFSPILRDWYDFAATVAGPPDRGYQTAALTNSIPLFSGTMTDSVRTTVQEYGLDQLEPGDLIIGNDPYRIGNHVNDVLFVRPVFADGEIVGFVNLKAHQLDMGGKVPGGFSTTKMNVYENGLVISPRPLLKAGRPVKENWTLIFDNARFGDLLFPDLKTICANLELGDRLLSETVARYGAAAVAGAVDYVCDAAAERMTLALEALPDGTWEGEELMDCDGLDDAEEYLIHVAVKVAGGRAEIDLSGSSRQARTCVNAAALDAKTTVGIAMKYLLDPGTPVASGMFRPVDVVLPEGTVVSALPPDGAVFVFYEPTNTLIGAMLRAFAAAFPERAIAGDLGAGNLHNGQGTRADGTPWASVGQAGGENGAWGATIDGDADSYNVTYQGNGIATPVEAIEAESPVAIMRREYVPDTAGAGLHRGGASVVKDSLWLEPTNHYFMPMRFKRRSGFGVNGGETGAAGGIWFWHPLGGAFAGQQPLTDDAYAASEPVAGRLAPETNAPDNDGEYVFYGRRQNWETEPSTLLRYRTNAGGGWGDPLERDPERVKRDVRDGYITAAAAREQYGVVVLGDPDTDPEGLEVDLEATAALRSR
jgi:N-methylhydantoinase B